MPRPAPQVLPIFAGRGGAGQDLLFCGAGRGGAALFSRGGAGRPSLVCCAFGNVLKHRALSNGQRYKESLYAVSRFDLIEEDVS